MKEVPLADAASTTPSNNDLIDNSKDVLASDHQLGSSPLQLNSPKSSSQKLCSNLQFSFQDLRTRREKRLSMLQSNNYRCQKVNVKRYLFNFI